MSALSLSRHTFWGIVMLLGAALILPARAPAQDTDCTALDRNDEPRDCTFLEEHGQCLWNAMDSYWTCLDESEGFLEELACGLGAEIDIFACNVEIPFRLIKELLD